MVMNRLSFGAGAKVMDKREKGKGVAGDTAAGKMEEKKTGKGKEAVKVTHKVKKELKK